MFKKAVEQDDVLETEEYFISISDLMISLLFIFILILSYVIFQFAEKKDILESKIKKIEQNMKNRKDLLQELKNELKSKNIDIDIDGDNGNIRLKSDLLFKQGSAIISDNGVYKIDEIAKLIVSKMDNPKYKNSIDTIFIEGHTDSVPIKVSNRCKAQWTNKELSAQRAINTYTQMIKATNGTIAKLKNNKNKHLLSYSGYANNRPICYEKDNMSISKLKECRAKNRRIEFYFTINTPDTSKLKEF